MKVTGEEIIKLLATVRRIGTVDNWADVAVQWIEAADAEIIRLRSLLAIHGWADGEEEKTDE